ncbi:MAG: DUF2178 domain-containing protein [Candidatus Thermoplasmatota archaeon]
MERKKFILYGLVITLVVGFVIGLSAIGGEPITAIAAVVMGMIVLYALKSRINQVIEDERIYRISEKASRRTIQVVGTTMGLLGLALIGLSKSGYLKLTDVGSLLAYFASVLIIVYLIFYSYYSRKLGE